MRCRSHEHFEFWSASDSQAAQTGNFVLMVKLVSIILTIKPAAAENAGEGTLNSRNQGISLKKSVRNARGLKAGKGKAETLWSIDLQAPHQTQAKEEIFMCS